jgi:hypothetical protein
LHMYEIRTPDNGDEIRLRWRAIPVAHGAYPHAGAALALLTRVHGSFDDVRPGVLVTLRRIRLTNHCNLCIGGFHISWNIQERHPRVN